MGRVPDEDYLIPFDFTLFLLPRPVLGTLHFGGNLPPYQNSEGDCYSNQLTYASHGVTELLSFSNMGITPTMFMPLKLELLSFSNMGITPTMFMP